MNPSPILSLLKKDFRLNRVPILGGAALIFTPYLIGFITYFSVRESFGITKIRNSLVSCPAIALVLTDAIAAVFGGAAFAYERRERWGDFLAMLPVARINSILSKCIVSLLFLLPVWAINLYAFDWLLRPNQEAEMVALFMVSIAVMLMCFGVAWLISSFYSSPAIAACSSIGVGLVCALLLGGTAVPFSFPSWQAEWVYLIQAGVCAAIGLASFAAGTIYYLLRTEP
jgi:ABC-type transport system involved in multi-copper enzyme maturation permease subunit